MRELTKTQGQPMNIWEHVRKPQEIDGKSKKIWLFIIFWCYEPPSSGMSGRSGFDQAAPI